MGILQLLSNTLENDPLPARLERGTPNSIQLHANHSATISPLFVGLLLTQALPSISKAQNISFCTKSDGDSHVCSFFTPKLLKVSSLLGRIGCDGLLCPTLSNNA